MSSRSSRQRIWPWLQRAVAGPTLLVLLMTSAAAGRITTPAIIAETIQPSTLANCMKWTVVGLCFWLDCGPTGCRIRVSILIGHYNPDLVVSGYHRVGDTPWVEMAALYGPAQKAAGQALVSALMPGLSLGEGDRPNEKFHRSHEDLTFKEADAIGHPIADLLNYLPEDSLPAGGIPAGFSASDVRLVCPSETAPFVPYLLSTVDFIAWRLAIPETVFPQSLLPGLREIGNFPRNTWQAVYPRHGFTLQAEPPKAGAVVAQRAGDVVTRDLQPHVYIPTSATRPSTPGLRVWWPGPLYEVDRKTGYWQFLVPIQTRACEVFGQDDTRRLRSWADGKVDEEGDYAWTLWRPYKCCQVKGDILLYTIEWVEWPP